MDDSKDIIMAKQIAKLVENKGGCAYFVGGYVRDYLNNIVNKDIDIEIHGIEVKTLENILDSVGTRNSIGESFGIYNLSGYSLDIAMPRKEKLVLHGHKDFEIMVDPYIGTYKASKRRDFTINSIMMNVLTGEIIDHHNGVSDLKKGIIRHIDDETFVEDPLRVLRACMFASRFKYTIDERTIDLCSRMGLEYLTKERVFLELKKALLLSDKPSIFFDYLRKMNQLNYWFKEVYELIGVEQSPTYHAEGDVYNHTMMVLDEASKYKQYSNLPLGFMLSALTHDFGKAICTKNYDGKIRAYGHETLGLPLIETFLKRLTNEDKLIKYVLNLSYLHMKPNALAHDNAKIKSTNKMFDDSVDPLALIYLSMADNYGRKMSVDFTPYEIYLFERYEIYKEYMSKPYVTGSDLIALGIEPDSNFSNYLDYSHKLRLAGLSKEEALSQTISYIKTSSKIDKVNK